MANKAEILITGRNTSNTAFKSVDKGMKGLLVSATKVSGAITAIGGGAALAGFTAFTKKVIDSQDELSKMSQKIGISVEGLAGLQHAGDLAGISLEGIQKAVKSVSTQLFDAASGLLESKRNFTSLGIEIKNTDGSLRKAEDVIVELADKFAKMEDATEKTALATKLFGRAGLDLIPLLNQGSDALARMIQEGKELNPVTAESARQSEVFNDNILRLQKSVKQVGIAIVTNIIPTIARMSEKFANATFETKNFWQVLIGTFLSSENELANPRKAIELITISLNKQKDKLAELNEGWHAFSDTRRSILEIDISAGESRISALRAELTQQQKDIFVAPQLTDTGSNEFKATIEDTTTGGKAASDLKAKLARQKSFVESEEKKAAVLGKTAAQIALLTAKELDLNAADTERVRIAAERAAIFREDAELTKKFQNDLEKNLTAKNAFIAAEEKEKQQSEDRQKRNDLELSLLGETEKKRSLILAQFDNEIIKREKIIELGKLDLDEVTRKQLEAQLQLAESRNNALAEQEQILESQKETTDQMTQFGVQAARNLQTAFADFLFDPFDKGLDGMLAGFADVLRRMVAEAAATELLGAIFGKTSGGGIDLFGGSGLLGSLFSGAGAFFGFAHGGFHQGGFRLVGEEGPELEATGPSRIFSVNQTRDILSSPKGGDNISINLNLATGVQQTVRVEVLNMMPFIEQKIQKAVADAKTRGGRGDSL